MKIQAVPKISLATMFCASQAIFNFALFLQHSSALISHRTNQNFKPFHLKSTNIIVRNELPLKKFEKLFTVEDITAITTLFPMIVTSIHSSITGQYNAAYYDTCLVASILNTFANLKMSYEAVRNYDYPRMTDGKTVYEFSFYYSLVSTWLLWHISPSYPVNNFVFEGLMTLLFTAVMLYGVFATYSGMNTIKERENMQMVQSAQVNENSVNHNDNLITSNSAVVEESKILLKGGFLVNILGLLFIPFAWTLCFRGNEWWHAICTLHPSQAALMGLSILVSLIGNSMGNNFFRLKELQIVGSVLELVTAGVLLNAVLLVLPEIVFHLLYSNGISEFQFYWE